MNYEQDDGLGAAHGLWSAVKLVGGIVLGASWVAITVRMARSGEWEAWLIASFFLGIAVMSFRHFETKYPQNRGIAATMTVISLTLFFRLVAI